MTGFKTPPPYPVRVPAPGGHVAAPPTSWFVVGVLTTADRSEG